MSRCLYFIENFLTRKIIPIFRENKPSIGSFSHTDSLLLILITFISIMVRFWAFNNPYKLISLEIPNQFYIKSERSYSRINHRPLGNVVFSILCVFTQINEEYFNSVFNKSSDPIFSTIKTPDNFSEYNFFHFLNADHQISMRIISSLFSSFIPSMIFMTIKLATFSTYAALVSSFFLIFDHSIIIDGRFCHPSSFFLFFSSISLLNIVSLFGHIRYSSIWTKQFFLTSISVALSIAIKRTAYSFLYIILFHEFIYLFIENNYKFTKMFLKSFLKIFSILIIPIISISFIMWLIQFSLVYHDFEFSSSDCQTFIEKSSLSSFQLFRLILTNCVYFEKKKNLNKTGIIDRIFLNKGDVLFHKYVRPNHHQYVLFSGNYFVYIFVLIGLILAALFKNHRKFLKVATFIHGYIFSVFWVVITNSHDLNDYLLPLLFGCACSGVIFDIIMNRYTQGFIMVIVIYVAFVGYQYWLPLICAEEITQYSVDKRIWRKNWL